ncbi:MAG: helix-turn-helix domain-containing protein [Bacteroidia bacterium]
MESLHTKLLTKEVSHKPEPEAMHPDDSISFDAFKDQEFGKAETPERIDFQAKARAFRVGAKLREFRKAQKMTQEELAIKIGTQKAYISRIENGADMQLSTLYKLFQFGLGLNVLLIIGEEIE